MLNREGCLVALMACAGVPRSLGKGLRAVRRGTRWIVDLRGHGGGNSHTTIAALAPLLPPGKLLAWVNGRGQEEAVVLTQRGVETDGELPRAPVFDPSSFPQALGARSDSPVVVWLGSPEAKDEYRDFTRDIEAIPADERLQRVLDEQLWDRRRKPR